MKKVSPISMCIKLYRLCKAKDWTQYVNPLMGSQSSFELSTGNTYPPLPVHGG